MGVDAEREGGFLGEDCEWPLKVGPRAPWPSMLLTGWRRGCDQGPGEGDIP